jgi:acyl dehydratase
MPLDPSFVGRRYPPTAVFEVGREKIREFADAIGDPNPVYRDADAARAFGHPDAFAPPTFLTGMSLEACHKVTDDPELGLDWSRVVHGDQKFRYVRPAYAGERLAVEVIVDSIKSLAGNDLLTLRAEVSTVDGEPVTTVLTLLVARAEDGS